MLYYNIIFRPWGAYILRLRRGLPAHVPSPAPRHGGTQASPAKPVSSGAKNPPKTQADPPKPRSRNAAPCGPCFEHDGTIAQNRAALACLALVVVCAVVLRFRHARAALFRAVVRRFHGCPRYRRELLRERGAGATARCAWGAPLLYSRSVRDREYLQRRPRGPGALGRLQGMWGAPLMQSRSGRDHG